MSEKDIPKKCGPRGCGQHANSEQHSHSKSHKAKDLVCNSCGISNGPWYREKLYILLAITALFFVLSYFFYKPLFDALYDYLKLLWWAILLGLLIGGAIDYLVPVEYIERFLGRHKKRSIFYAIFFGFLMSACSHGILAIAIELYKKGANTSSVIAFLLASPWANIAVTVLLFGFFGIKALFIVFSAIIIAIITGLIYQQLEKRDIIECDKCKNGIGINDHKEVKLELRRIFIKLKEPKKSLIGVAKGSLALAKMIMWWLLIGMILASLARTFVPTDIFQQYMGATILGMIITLLLATIIEVCSEGSSPLAFEIFKQTGAFGNSFIFLMAGVVTDYTEIGLIWSNIGKKAAIWLPIITVPQVIILGYIFNQVF